MKKILIATDGSDSGHEAVELGLELAEEQGAWAHILHVAPLVDVVPYSNFGFIAPSLPHEFDERDYEPLERAVELTPQSPQTLYNLAFTYYQLKRFADARGPLQTAVERWPDLFPLNALYGAILFNLGEMSAAYHVLHHSHQLNPQDAGATALLYQSTLELAERSEQNSGNADALRYLQEAASLAPTDPEPHRRMAAIYRRIGQIPKAEQEEQRAAELSKSSKY